MTKTRFTTRDLLAVVAVTAVLLAVLLPVIGRHRERSRRAACSENLKLLVIGLHNYHLAYRRLPSAMSGTADNQYQLSGFVAMTGFLDEQELWEEITRAGTISGGVFPDMGPTPWNKRFKPWQATLPILLCPSDNGREAHWFGPTNYAFCIGDSAVDIHSPNKDDNDFRGMFSPRAVTELRSAFDGLSSTIALGEIASERERRIIGQFAIDMPKSLAESPLECLETSAPRKLFYKDDLSLSRWGRGSNWADGAAGYALMQTILPPNSPSCAIGGALEVDGYFSAASRHPGGCHIGMGDGAVRFVTQQINVGDLLTRPQVGYPSNQPDRAGMRSSYGVWGALGTRSGGEPVLQHVLNRWAPEH